MIVLIKGAGDLASGVALRLWRAGLKVAMTDLPEPTAIRRTVSFCVALTEGSAKVEDVIARPAKTLEDAEAIWAAEEIPVFAAPDSNSVAFLKPEVVVDAILAKRNIGTTITDAPTVIALGPGFTTGVDCHAVIETMRGHNLGRVHYHMGSSAMPNTGIPGEIGGHTTDRVMHTPAQGVFKGICQIGERVGAGETVAMVGDTPVLSKIEGVLRGLLADGIYATEGMKCGDVDPRAKWEHCFTVSDKARSLGGAVLEAIVALGGDMRGKLTYSPDPFA